MTQPLGRTMHFHSFALSGWLTNLGWHDFLNDLAQAIGMTPVYRPAIWNYPVQGEGGRGQTIVQPITESFLAIDAWPDHRGAYLIVCSCRPFNPCTIKHMIAKWGLTAQGECGHELNIPEERHAQAV